MTEKNPGTPVSLRPRKPVTYKEFESQDILTPEHPSGQFQVPSSSSITPPSSTAKDKSAVIPQPLPTFSDKEIQTEWKAGPQESELSLEAIQETLKRKIENTDDEKLPILQEKFKILKMVQETAGKELPSKSSQEYTIRLSKISDIVHF